MVHIKQLTSSLPYSKQPINDGYYCIRQKEIIYRKIYIFLKVSKLLFTRNSYVCLFIYDIKQETKPSISQLHVLEIIILLHEEQLACPSSLID